MRKVLQILVITMINIILVGCSSDISQNQMSVDQVLKQGPTQGQNAIANNVSVSPNAVNNQSNPDNANKADDKKPAQKATVSNNNEEKVIISVSNFGRVNPFKPFQERSLVAGMDMSPYNLPQLKNIPPPPMYNPSPAVEKLIGIKVNGILSDPNGSSAIVNIEDNDYLIHKGDMIFDFYIKDITGNKVVIKYGNNTYRAGIGEVIKDTESVENVINPDPVKGINKMFGGSKRISTLPEIKLVTPTYNTNN